MTTVYDVPADLLINNIAKELNKNKKITPPEWVNYVKTGVHKERRPENSDWWYTRCASILRRIYVDGPVGLNSLRSYYGGKKDNGSSPEKFAKGSGSIIRTAIHQLEDVGYIARIKEGRIITPEGKSFLDNASNVVKKDVPELAKY
ncbi:MAG: 30S ribosomal protein S19e [Methanobacterium sp.]